ncbi:MAG: hemolysin family protein [Deltaproteobacteria bacterium]|nr:hemolysin family protein [Deltaproteobacteria bacterium]
MDDGSSKQGILAWLSKPFRKNSLSPAKIEEEITDLLDQGAETGVINKLSGEMIQSIFEFNETVARQIMTPRVAVVGVDRAWTIGQVIALARAEGYSRLPVYQGDLDHILGFLMVKDLLGHWGEDLSSPLPLELIRPITLAHGNRKIVDLLTELRHRKNHLAIVLDEYGGTAGLVTMEDIIEEIIGDIHDEYDQEEEDNIKELAPGVLLATGQTSISELNDKLNRPLPEGDYETLGGFLTDQVSRVPLKNEQIHFEDYVFYIRAADSRKVEQVEIRLAQADHPPTL